MNNGFPLVPLGEVLTKSREQVEIDPHQRYKQVTIKLWGQGVVLRDEVAGAEIAGARRFVVRPQQFILSRIDARNGAFGLVPDLLDGAVVSNDFPAFTPNPSQILPAFLGWMSKTRSFVDLCRAASEGTTNRVRLKEDRFMATKIPLPPLPEQQRIVGRIAELAARIEEARGLRRQAVEEAEALVDAELDRAFAAISQKAETLFIGDAGGFVTSGPRGWGEYYDEGGSHRLIRVENVWNRELDLSTAARVALPNRAGDIERSEVRAGDVLVTITGAIGRVGVVRRFDLPSHVSQHVALVRPPKSVYPDYLYWFLRSPSLGRSQTEGKTYGATKPGINLTSLRKLQVPTPSSTEQENWASYFSELQVEVNLLKQLQDETTAELDALLPSLLDRALKGGL